MDPDLLECPYCNNSFGKKIYQCGFGHSFCQDCNKRIKECPECCAPLQNARNIALEKIVANFRENEKVSCENPNCTYKLKHAQMHEHVLECKYRTHTCQGSQFSNWGCKWSGTYENLLDHYKKKHPDHAQMPAVVKGAAIKYATFKGFKDTQIISFLDGKQLFYFKHKLDSKKEKAYWLFQFVGPKHEANNYMYEFEINKGQRKFKINDFCTSDTEDCDEIMENERCVCLSYKQLAGYLDDEKEASFCFRIMNANHAKKDVANTKKEPRVVKK